ncbi:hypothetical protein DMJ13_05815 [halophilic archaeon]|nr:hypothetical protein DMJ13_05815 [halophilic archaeon]
MARDETVRDSKRDRLIDRRSYLKLAGAAVVSAAAAGTATAANYDTITVPAGETKTIDVGDGQTFENKLIDMTADGASALVTTSGSNWTIRNVGFKGTHPGGHYLMTPGVADVESTGLVENVYMGDGQVARSGSGGIWVDANMPHKGTITFRNVHVAGFIDNGLYGSGPGAQGYGGNLHIESSYFTANTISNVRLNAKERPCNVTDTVVDATGNDPCGEGCSAPGSTTTRAVWSWYGETHLRNCDVVGSIATAKGGSVTKTNTRTGDDADLTPPKGVPMSAKAAASGSGTGGSSGKRSSGNGAGKQSADGSSSGNAAQATVRRVANERGLPNVISIASSDAGTTTDYELTVSGKLRKSTDRNATKDAEDAVEDGTATGAVAGGTDSYRFGGAVTNLDIDGTATVFLNGERVSSGEVGLPNALVVDGSGSPNAVSEYSFDVSGTVRGSGDLGRVEAHDTVESKRVNGRIVDAKDGYRFSGRLTRFEVDGPATVTLEPGEN